VVTAEPNRPHRAPDELLERVQEAVCHEDADFLVLNKPADLPVHGGSSVAYGLIEVLRQARPQDDFLELGHRLDRETSGCLIGARRRPALQALHAALRTGETEKIYGTLLVNAWKGGAREVSVALQKVREGSGSHMVEADEEGREARSLFTPEKTYKTDDLALSQMRVRIYTGRTHQIRVHAAHIGHPVAGDAKYGDFEANHRLRELGLRRMFLHALSLSVELPSLKRRLEAKVPLAPELREFLQKLRG
jgi:23S rRNA pseudouridine955/2504/2580 synthase